MNASEREVCGASIHHYTIILNLFITFNPSICLEVKKVTSQFAVGEKKNREGVVTQMTNQKYSDRTEATQAQK